MRWSSSSVSASPPRSRSTPRSSAACSCRRSWPCSASVAGGSPAGWGGRCRGSASRGAATSRTASRRGPRPAGGPKGAALGRFGALRRPLLGGRLGDQGGLQALLDRLLGHHALLDVPPRGELELHVEQRLLEDRPQRAGAGLPLEGLVGDRLERLLGEDELDAVELEEPLELPDERVARLGEDRDEIVPRQLVDHRYHREAADELGDQSVVHEVLGEHLLEELAGVLVVAGA